MGEAAGHVCATRCADPICGASGVRVCGRVEWSALESVCTRVRVQAYGRARMRAGVYGGAREPVNVGAVVQRCARVWACVGVRGCA